MNPLALSEHERLLLTAALNADPIVASSSWDSWMSQRVIEQAPYAELRLFPAVYANLSRIAPGVRLPKKLRGKAKATFTLGNVLAHKSLPIVEELSRQTPVILAKGLGFCIRFNAWAARPIRDVDIYVPFKSMERAATVLQTAGWTPKYGSTWASLLHRTSLKRGSWNFTKDGLDLDLHWRLLDGEAQDWLDHMMWTSADRVVFFGGDFQLQSPEFAFVSSLRHGFVEGERADLLQTIVDAASWLPICQQDVVDWLLPKVGLSGHYRALISTLHAAARSNIASDVSADRPAANVTAMKRSAPAGRDPILSGTWRFFGGRSLAYRLYVSFDETAGVRAGLPLEKAVLRHPMLYRLWALFGRRAFAESLLVRFVGPFSKPLDYTPTFYEVYDLRNCETVDRVAGPGFAWPQPDNTCFWSDYPDARLLVPLNEVADHVLLLELAEQRRDSPNGSVSVFANGTQVAKFNMHEFYRDPGYSIVIPKRCLCGPWIELSFRPNQHRDKTFLSGSYVRRRSVPFRMLRVYTLRRLSAELGTVPELQRPIPELNLLILTGKEPYASKHKRIQQKIANSALKDAEALPNDFDPVLYVLRYRDLFEAEVDPYEHYLRHGKLEHRWYR
jgi:Uncharacterised nucleotidyltransferase